MISILGCGWYGLALAKALVEKGEEVKGSTTSELRFPELKRAGVQPFLIEVTEQGTAHAAEFFETETLIVCIPPKIRSGQTAAYLSKINNIVNAVIHHGVKQIVYISSTGVYPDNNQTVDELVIPQPDSASGQVLFAAEQLFMQQTTLKTTVVRFGGLVGPGRHPGRFFAGKTAIENGRAPVNLIHLQDCVQITLSILQQRAFGYLFNACSPSHPQKQEFYTQASAHAGLPLPQFKDELNNWKTVNSVNLNRIINYEFMVKDWDSSFAENKF